MSTRTPTLVILFLGKVASDRKEMKDDKISKVIHANFLLQHSNLTRSEPRAIMMLDANTINYNSLFFLGPMVEESIGRPISWATET